jgi:SAM-dependent methyltransferase
VAAEAPAADRVEAARRAVERNDHWYHSIELAPGVVTPGRIDLRKVAGKILPNDLSGKRALDVGSFDGFWAFQMERRGAEVVAIDIDHPDEAEYAPRAREMTEANVREFDVRLERGFDLAAELLGSRVRRVVCNVLELTPEAIGGRVDFAFIGALLIHLRDPVRALQNVHATLVPGGELRQLETVSIRDTLMAPRRPVAGFHADATWFNWWHPNRSALRAWARAAGFEEVRGLGFHHPPQRKPMDHWQYGMSSRRPA